jgi:hypothetical protein
MDDISLVKYVPQVLGSVSFDVSIKERNAKANTDDDDGDVNNTDSNTNALKQSDIETIWRLDTIDYQFWMPLSMEKKQRNRGTGPRASKSTRHGSPIRQFNNGRRRSYFENSLPKDEGIFETISPETEQQWW